MSNHFLWLVSAMTLVLANCSSSDEKVEAPTIAPIPVETVVVRSSPFVDMVEVSGVVEPIHEVKVSAEAPGRVLSAPFEEGDFVKKGKLLLRVDSRMDSARIALLNSQRSTTRREFERTKKLASQGLATPQQLDQAQAQVDAATLAIKQAKVGLGKTNVRSPISGYIAQKFAEKGEYVNPGAPLAHIVDYTVVKVKASVPESDIRYIEEGKVVRVYLPALEQYFEGKVARRGIIAAPNTRTFPVEVHIDNADLKILPGMRARLLVPRKDWGEVVIVPRDAILEGFREREAMVLPGSKKEGKAELRTVVLGPAKGAMVVITDGLKAGERLIVKGHRSIVQDTLVKVVAERSKPEPASAQVQPKGDSTVVDQ